MQKELQSIFEALPHVEQCAMLGIKPDAVKPKPQPQPQPSNDAVPVVDASNTPPKEVKEPTKVPVANGEAENASGTGDADKKKVGRPKNPETAAKVRPLHLQERC